MPRRTLAEELAELATTGPAPDLDPEADAFGEGAALVDSDGDEGGALLGARRLRGDIGDLGEEYAGRRTSAAAAFGGGDAAGEQPTSTRGPDVESSASEDEEDDVALIGAGEPDESDSDIGSPEAMRRSLQQPAGPTANGHRQDGSGSSGDDGGSQESDQQRRQQPFADGAASSGGEDSDDDAAADGADAAVARMMAAAAGGRGHDGSAQPAADGTLAATQSPEEDDGLMRQPSPDADGELEALEREFDAVAAADADAAAGLASKAQADWRRGIAAGRQRRLWERALEVRIRAQRAVSAAHQLPGPEAHAVAAASPRLGPAFAVAAEAAAAAVGELLALQRALLDQNPAVAEAEAEAAAGGSSDGGSGKRQREGDPAISTGTSQATAELWQQIEDATMSWAPYRDASLDRWHRRAALSGGAAAARTGLKALAQPLSAQVASALAVPGRLLARSQLPRDGAPRVLCEPGEAADRPAAEPAAHSSPAGDATRSNEQQHRLPHTYDDADLYEQLLKEYLEGAGAPGGGAATLQRAPKRRKVVDRRASKGRKLRFHVHDKLVNFMTPASNGGSADNGMGAALFTNLFGQRQQPAAAAQLA